MYFSQLNNSVKPRLLCSIQLSWCTVGVQCFKGFGLQKVNAGGWYMGRESYQTIGKNVFNGMQTSKWGKYY